MIRIIDSCAGSVNMVTAKGAETRILSDGSIKWKEVSLHCITNKLYLIVTPCVNDGYNHATIPTDTKWKQTVSDMCTYLKGIGANKYNSKVSIINEPTKWFRDNGGVARYTHFINMAYPIVHNAGFRMGAGNMEFRDAMLLGDWYQYICHNASFDDLDIHIQASCDTEEKIRTYTDYALLLANSYGKELDCTEAFYGNITTSTGWELLKRQRYHAERIGCKNFGPVFHDLDTTVFPVLQDPKTRDKWFQLCFNINGALHSQYWPQWKYLIDNTGPVPNIYIPIEDDDMKLVNLKPGLKGGQIRWLQEILMLEYGYQNDFNDPFDGKYGNATFEQVKQYQTANGLTPDGVVGINTTLDLVFDVDEKPVTARYKSTDYWDKRLKIMVAYWPVTEI